jgi:hypothetical protein
MFLIRPNEGYRLWLPLPGRAFVFTARVESVVPRSSGATSPGYRRETGVIWIDDRTSAFQMPDSTSRSPACELHGDPPSRGLRSDEFAEVQQFIFAPSWAGVAIWDYIFRVQQDHHRRMAKQFILVGSVATGDHVCNDGMVFHHYNIPVFPTRSPIHSYC